MRKRNHHDWLQLSQKARKLRKKDKRAAKLLIATRDDIHASDFGDGSGGRWSYCTSDFWGEWDEIPALCAWTTHRLDEHPNACAWLGWDKDAGVSIPDGKMPRPMRLHEQRKWYALTAPAGFRWRGGRLVPVDKHGAMIGGNRNTASSALKKSTPTCKRQVTCDLT